MTETATLDQFHHIERLMDACPACGRAIPPTCEGVMLTWGDEQHMKISHAFWCMDCECFWLVEQQIGRKDGCLFGPTRFSPPRLMPTKIEDRQAHAQVFGRRGLLAPRKQHGTKDK